MKNQEKKIKINKLKKDVYKADEEAMNILKPPKLEGIYKVTTKAKNR